MQASHPAAAANAEQIESWNGAVGERWLTYNDWLDQRTAAYGRAALAAAAARPGESVLDVGCGAGATAIELARAVAPGGSVIGVDVSEPLLGRARERSAGLDLPLEFRLGDASRPLFPAQRFDLLFSRFGVMFFDDPAGAFAQLRRTLRPGGRIAFACWQAPELNDWYTLPLRAIADVLPQAPVDPLAPGPFALADRDRLRGLLQGAGFQDVAIEPFQAPFYVGLGDSVEAMAADAMEQVFRVGPVARLLQGQDEAVRERAQDAIRQALAGLADDQGIQVGGATWVVTARAAG